MSEPHEIERRCPICGYLIAADDWIEHAEDHRMWNDPAPPDEGIGAGG